MTYLTALPGVLVSNHGVYDGGLNLKPDPCYRLIASVVDTEA